MCSKCYRDHTKHQQPQKAPEPPKSEKPVERPAVEAATAGPSEAAAAAVEEPSQPQQANPGRCFCWCAVSRGVRGSHLRDGQPSERSQAFGPRVSTSHFAQTRSSVARSSKKVGLTGFKCRCNYIFCSTHRYADQHSCTFDYKTHGQSALAKANPTVVAEKVQKVRQLSV